MKEIERHLVGFSAKYQSARFVIKYDNMTHLYEFRCPVFQSTSYKFITPQEYDTMRGINNPEVIEQLSSDLFDGVTESQLDQMGLAPSEDELSNLTDRVKALRESHKP